VKTLLRAFLLYCAFALVAATRISSAQTSVWVNENQLPYTPAFHQAFASGDTLTVIGGDIGSGPVSDSFQATIRRDGTLDDWTQANPLPGPVADASLAIGPTQVFLVGGTNGKITLRSVMRAQIEPDGKLGPWVMLPDLLPEPRRGVRAFVQGGRLFVMGGRDEAGKPVSNGWSASVVSTGIAGGWQSAPSLPQPIAEAAIAQIDGWTYLVGGDGDGSKSSVYSASPNLSLGWAGQGTSVFPAASSASVAVGTRIHVFGGSTGSGIVDTWESAARQSNGVVSGWRTEGQIPQKLVGAVAVAKDGRVYLTGGFNGVRFQSTVYRWDTEDAVQTPVQPATLYRGPGARQQLPVANLPLIPAVGTVAIVSLAIAIVLLIREHFRPDPRQDQKTHSG
jgi:N-acetylneuraminic acid mutarotase